MKLEDAMRLLSDMCMKEDRMSVNTALLTYYWPPPDELRSFVERRSIRIWQRVLQDASLPNSYLSMVKRLERIILPKGYTLIKENYRARTRIYLGAGTSGWDVGIYLMKPYGVPVIPGSSLKGVMEDVALREMLEEIGGKENLKNLIGDDMCLEVIFKHNKAKISNYKLCSSNDFSDPLSKIAKMFGTREERGDLWVIGGFPVAPKRGILAIDIASPHYSKYYRSRGEIPSEGSDPIPIQFPVVREGTSFMFLLAVPEEDKEYAARLLEKVLTERGVGGRTNAGYGILGREMNRPYNGSY